MVLLPIFAKQTAKLRQCVEEIDSTNYLWLPTSAGSSVAIALANAERSTPLSDQADEVLDVINHLAELCHRRRMALDEGEDRTDDARAAANQEISIFEHILKSTAPSQRAKNIGLA